jgi:hypothetical protein
LHVSDCGPDTPGNGNNASRNGVGLTNTRTRLEELYGAQHGFELRPQDGGGLAVSLKIPFRVMAENSPVMVVDAGTAAMSANNMSFEENLFNTEHRSN